MRGKAFIKPDGEDILVGYTAGNYYGPTARIEYDDTWLHIITDHYDGHAMLNIETLPYLRRALAQIAKEVRIQKARPPDPNSAFKSGR